MRFFHCNFFKNLAGVITGTIIGIIAGLSLIFIMFVTAFEIACYSDYGFYEKEYRKYNVNNEHSI